MAKVLGIDQSTLSRIERGLVAPAHHVYEALQRIMDMTLQEMVVQSREDLASPVDGVEPVQPGPVPQALEQLLFKKRTCEHQLMDLDKEMAALELRLLTAKDEQTLYECERAWLETRVKALEEILALGDAVAPTQAVKVLYHLEYQKHNKELLQLRANKNVLSDAELFRLEYRLEEMQAKKAWLEQKIAGLANEIEAAYQQALATQATANQPAANATTEFAAQISVVTDSEAVQDAETLRPAATDGPAVPDIPDAPTMSGGSDVPDMRDGPDLDAQEDGLKEAG